MALSRVLTGGFKVLSSIAGPWMIIQAKQTDRKRLGYLAGRGKTRFACWRGVGNDLRLPSPVSIELLELFTSVTLAVAMETMELVVKVRYGKLPTTPWSSNRTQAKDGAPLTLPGSGNHFCGRVSGNLRRREACLLSDAVWLAEDLQESYPGPCHPAS